MAKNDAEAVQMSPGGSKMKTAERERERESSREGNREAERL